MRRSIVRHTILLALAVAGTVQAEEPFDPAARAKTIAPFIDAETVAIVHADLSRVDIDALVDEIVKLIPEVEEREEETLEKMAVAQKVFCGAGGKEVYVVFSLADLNPGDRPAPFLIVPLGDGADEKALSALFSQLGKDGTEQFGDVLCVGHPRARERLKQLQPDPRPELVKAFEAAGDTAAQVLLLPTADNRRVIEELMPELPEEVGGGPSTVLTRGMLWMAIGIDPPPQMSLRVVIQSEDAQAASALREKLGTTYEWLARQEEVVKLVTKFDELTALLTPEVQGDRLTLVLNQQNQGIGALLAALTPPVQRSRLHRSMNNVKQIALAMHMYHGALRRFPAAASYDADGKPLLSWRVHMLPFIEQKKLYDQFHLDEPWDSEHNHKLIDKMPAIYRSPGSKLREKGRTNYLVPVGEETAFPGREGFTFEDIKDGASKTIMVVEAGDDHAVIWTKPEDLPFDPEQPGKGLGGLHKGGWWSTFCDGSVHFLADTVDPKVLRALFTRAGGEVIRSEDIIHPR